MNCFRDCKIRHRFKLSNLVLFHQRLSFIFFFLLDSTDFGICSFVGNPPNLLCFSLIMSPFISVSASFSTNLIMKALNLFSMLSGQIVLLLTMSKRNMNTFIYFERAKIRRGFKLYISLEPI